MSKTFHDVKQKKKGIGWDGKTLKQMRREIDELSKKTGYYAGLKTLPLKNQTPFDSKKSIQNCAAA